MLVSFPTKFAFTCLCILLFAFPIFAQVNVNSTATPDLCVGSSGYSALGTITISESVDNAITLTNTPESIIITPTIPGSFEFEPGVGTINFLGFSNLDVTATISVTASQIEIFLSDVSDNHESGINSIEISGINIRAITTNTSSVLERLGGSLAIVGFANGDDIAGSSIESFLPPSVANAGTDRTGIDAVCGGSVSLNANVPATGTGFWSFSPVFGSNPDGLPLSSFTDTNANNTAFNGTPGNTYRLRWTITNGPCDASFDDVLIEFNQPVAADAGSNITSCNTTLNLSAVTPSLGTGSWSFVSNPDNLGAISNLSSPTSLFSGARGTTYGLRWTVANGVCVSFENITVTIQNTPTTANAGSDITVCGNLTPLSANSPVIGTGSWSFSPAPGSNPDSRPLSSFSDIFSNSSGFSGTQGQTYRLRWTINFGVCPSSFDEVLVHFNSNPTPVNAGLDKIVCSNSVVLSAQPPVIGSGFWSFSTDLGSNPDGLPLTAFSDINSFASTFTGTQGNTYKLRWTVANGVCTPQFDEVIVQFDPSPSAAVAGLDQQVCGTSTNLTATVPAIGTGVWSFSPANTGTGGNINNTTQANSSFTGTAGQTYILRWTVSNGVCASVFDEVVIRLDEIPSIVNAGADQEVCGGFTTLQALTPNVGTGQWSFVSNPDGLPLTVFGDRNSITSTFSGTPGLTYILRWTVTNGVCAGVVDDVTINLLEPLSVANAGLDQNICGNTTSLTATPPVFGIGTWSFSPLPGSNPNGLPITAFSDVNNPSSTFTGTPGFTYRLRWIVSNGVCPVNEDEVLISFPVVPTVAASDQTICSGVSTNVVITNPNSVAGTTFNWVVLSNPGSVAGTSSGSGSNITQLLTHNSSTQQIVTYRITPTGPTGCVGASSNVSVFVDPIPFISNNPVALTQVICSNEQLNFSPMAIPASTINWSATFSSEISSVSVTTTGTGNITDTPINISNGNGTVTYTLTPIVNGCTGPSQNFVVTVKPLPSVSSVNTVICSESNAVFTLTNAPQNIPGTTYSWTATLSSGTVTGFANGTGNVINQNLVSVATGGVVNYEVTPSANGCAGPSQVFVVQVNGKAIIDAGADFQVCEPSTVSIAGVPLGSSTTGSWQVEPGFGFGTISGSGISAVYNVAPQDIGGFVRLRVTSDDPDGAGPCLPATDLITINVNRAPQISAMPDFTICEPTSINLTSTISASSSTANWSISSVGTGTISASSLTLNTVTASYFPTPSDITQTIVFRVVTNDPDNAGPCVPAEDFVNVTINRSAKVNAGTDFRICEYDNVQLNGSFADSPSAIWSGGASPMQYGNVNNPITQYTLNATERNSTNLAINFRLTAADPDGAGPCTSVFDEVLVQVADTLNFVTIVGLNTVYAENEAPVNLVGVPAGGVFSSIDPGVFGNTFFPSIAQVSPAINTIIYTFTDPTTGCISAPRRTVIVNEVTAVDFSIAGSTLGNDGAIQICSGAGNGEIRISGSPEYNDPSANVAFFSSTSSELNPRIFQNVSDNGFFYINTANLPAGEYDIRYSFTNQVLATVVLAKVLRVFPKPDITITTGNTCKDDVVEFRTDIISKGASISGYDWDFGNTLGSNLQSPDYQYPTRGDYNVVATVSTTDGCEATASKVIRIGEIEVLDFNWTSICSSEITEFNTSKIQTGASTIVNYTWTFPTETGTVQISGPPGPIAAPDDAVASGNYQAPRYLFASSGLKDVGLQITTDDGCQQDVPKKVFILDFRPAEDLNQNPYLENFKSGQGTWFKTNDEFEFDVASLNANSFIFGNPSANGLSVFNVRGTDPAVWYTNGYRDVENSVVIGPCVNLSNVPSPMIALDFWVDADIRDGAVVQYSTNGGLNWTTLGNDNLLNGIDWYNDGGLIGNPGGVGSGQNIGSFGWTGKSGKWIKARYPLDEIPVAARSKVVFRVAFGSNNNNPTGTRTEKGFAFDNVYIGPKTKTVLVEHFANRGISTSLSDGVAFDNEYANQVIAKGKSDFVKVQYHLSSPAADLINENSPEVPASRQPFYSVDSAPKTFMNGLIGSYEIGEFRKTTVAELNGGEVEFSWTALESLKSPKFDIETIIDAAPVNATSVNFAASVTYLDSLQATFTEPLVLHSYLIQSDTTLATSKVRHIVNKALLGVTGLPITQTWTFSPQTQVQYPASGNITVDLDKRFDLGDRLLVFTFIQNRNTKEIYQVKIDTVDQTVTQKIPPVIVGVEDDIVKTELSEITVYPNPAFGEFNLLGKGTMTKAYTWQIVSQQGVVIKTGDLPKRWDNPMRIETNTMADGIYFVVFSSENGPVVYKKLVVINSK
ncbi:MAG: PKD-like domain-containing protein [Chryseotalea sp.]